MSTQPRTMQSSRSWAELHAAIGRACRAQGAGQDHHRACIADIKAEDAPDVPAYIALFNAIAGGGK